MFIFLRFFFTIIQILYPVKIARQAQLAFILIQILRNAICVRCVYYIQYYLPIKSQNTSLGAFDKKRSTAAQHISSKQRLLLTFAFFFKSLLNYTLATLCPREHRIETRVFELQFTHDLIFNGRLGFNDYSIAIHTNTAGIPTVNMQLKILCAIIVIIIKNIGKIKWLVFLLCNQ